MPDPAPRIPQIAREEWTDSVRDMFAVFEGRQGWEEGSPNPVLKTFARHPDLTEPFLVFNRHLLRTSTLPTRLRQIAIHRVAWTRGATYMWSSHLRLSLGIAMTREDFEAIKVGASSPHWSGLERDILRAVDQLRDLSQMDDETWDALSAHLDTRQMMDFLFTVGAYMLLAIALNAMRVQREPDLIQLAEEYGAP